VFNDGSSHERNATEDWNWPLTPPSTEIKNEWSYTSIPPYAFMAYTDKFTFTYEHSVSETLSLSSFKTGGGGAEEAYSVVLMT
jgi:hypothetical protein